METFPSIQENLAACVKVLTNWTARTAIQYRVVTASPSMMEAVSRAA